jgi:hypothetical protein
MIFGKFFLIPIIHNFLVGDDWPIRFKYEKFIIKIEKFKQGELSLGQIKTTKCKDVKRHLLSDTLNQKTVMIDDKDHVVYFDTKCGEYYCIDEKNKIIKKNLAND